MAVCTLLNLCSLPIENNHYPPPTTLVKYDLGTVVHCEKVPNSRTNTQGPHYMHLSLLQT